LKYEKRDGELLYVPLTVNIIGDDNGSERMSDIGVLAALNTLNTDYEAANIQFYLASIINHEFYSVWNEHESVLDGADMMFALNKENTINCYILKDGAGNCGYNLPYAGMVVSNNCASISDHTWAHEMGHGLSLPHPFLGWEGGQSWDGTMPPNFGSPAPERVTIDYTYFQDTLIRDTLIIDTVYVEKVDRSNCTFAADGFCDTQPDYLATRWPCTASNSISATEQTDPNGEKFRSDGTLIMSYADDKCASRFSDEQIAAMRANLIDEKPFLLNNQTPKDSIGEYSVDLISPFDEEMVYYRDIHLDWSDVDLADYYLVQFSKFSGFQIVAIDTIVSGSDMVMPKLELNKKYYWRIMPFNSHNFDFIFSQGSSFTTSEVSSAVDISNEIICQPTVIHAGQSIRVSLENNNTLDELKLIDINGKVLQSVKNIENTSIEINTVLQPGSYFVSITSGSHSGVKRIVVF
jgi:hypothetical protein